MAADDTILNNRYQLIKKIGEGGFAQVYLATDNLLRRQVAVKILKPDLSEEENFLERFETEAQSVAKLNHANILPVYDYGLSGDTAYLVTPFVEGGTLHDMLRQKKKLTLAEASQYLTQLAAALDYAHRRNIVHRDIKPQNVLVQPEDEDTEHLFLADFGIAKVVSASATQNVTRPIGTLSYMAPEQLRGNVSRSTDIYALGCLLFRFLIGQPPYVGPTEQVLTSHLYEPIPSIVARSNGQLSPLLQEVIEKALAKKPEERYQTAGELARAFQRVVASMPGSGVAAPTIQNTQELSATIPITDNRPLEVADDGNEADFYTPLGSVVQNTPVEELAYKLPENPPAAQPPNAAQTQTQPPIADKLPASSSNAALVNKNPNITSELPKQPPITTDLSASENSPPKKGRGLLIGGITSALVAIAVIIGLIVALGGGTTPSVATSTPAVAVAPIVQATVTVTAVPSAAAIPATATAIPPTFTPGPTATAVVVVVTATPIPPTATPLPTPTLAALGQFGAALTPISIGQTGEIRAVAFSKDNKMLATMGGDRSLKLWTFQTPTSAGRPTTISSNLGQVNTMAFSPDSKLLATGSDDTTVRIWDVATRAQVASFSGAGGNVWTVAFNQDGTILATGGDGGSVLLYDVAGKKEIGSVRAHPNQVYSVAFSPDGKQFVTGGGDFNVKLWETDSRIQLEALQRHGDFVRAVAFHPGGKLIASGSNDGSVKVWDIAQGKEVNNFRLGGSVSAVNFSPDAKTLVGAASGTALLWDITNGQQVGSLAVTSNFTVPAVFSADGRVLATGGSDDTVRLWAVSR